ncbi:sulfotransferase family protein [Kordiimonas sp.]|uniref:sulfotransferase family protein n=1 Tax=Kordiimonas sp. TaxID=1970157 RepID=UPI003A9332FA
MVDFVLAGTFKSASSTISYELDQHPGIFIPQPKDPYFYMADLSRTLTAPKSFMMEHDRFAVLERDRFEALFAEAEDNALRGDATPLYLYCHTHSIPQIQADNPNTKILIVLRNPADRAFSNYKHNVKDGYETRSFSECIDTWEETENLPLHPFFHYVRAGFYDAQVAAYQEAFEQVKIVSYDDIQDRPQELLNDIARFLGIEPNFKLQGTIQLNKSGKPRSRLLHDFIQKEGTIKKVLRPVYRTLVGNQATRKSISEKIKNLNLDSGRMTASERAALSAIYADDLRRLSRRPNCDFVTQWIP